MTTTPPQKEYIITEFQLKQLQGYADLEFVCQAIRSRPHTSTPNPCIEQGCDDIDNCDEICDHSRIYSPAWVKQHDATIRNATLDEAITQCEWDHPITQEDVWRKLESLRKEHP